MQGTLLTRRPRLSRGVLDIYVRAAVVDDLGGKLGQTSRILRFPASTTVVGGETISNLEPAGKIRLGSARRRYTEQSRSEPSS